MTEALSRHADEVYEELPDDDHRLLCMKLFKAITEKQANGRGIRRPLPFGEIDEITGHQRDKMLTVIDAYRPTGRTFIMPGENVRIHDKIIIDISHESLMRVWQRLKNWVNEESDSARIYVRLCETAQLHNRGEAGFYRDPDLKIALSWRDTNKPNANWGTRINDSFELAMRFLDDSREDFEAEQKAKEEARKRELEQAKALAEAEKQRAEFQRKSAKRNKVFAFVLFLLAVFAGVMAYQATLAEDRAVASEKEAQENLSFSYVYQADRMLRDDQAGKAFALLGQRHAQDPSYDMIPRKIANHLNHQPFLRQSTNIYKNKEDIMLRARKGFIYTLDYKKCFFLHNSREKAYVKSVESSTGKVVFQSEYLSYVDELNCTPNGEYVFVTGTDLENNFAGFVVNGTTGEFTKKYTDKQTVTAISGSDDLSRVLVGNQDGELKVYNAQDDKLVFSKNYGYKIHQIKVSPKRDNAIILALKDDSYYDVYRLDLKTFQERKCYSSPRDQLRLEAWLQYSPKGNYFIQFGGNFALGHINVFSAHTGEMLWANDTSHFRFMITADISHDETVVATPSIDATVRLWDIKTGIEVSQPLQHDGGVWYSVFSPDQTKIATLTDQNDIWIWSGKNGKLFNFPTRQKAELVGICFNGSGDKLYSVSIDGVFLEWDLNVPTISPIMLTHDDTILSYEMSEDGGWVVTGGRDKKVSVWDMTSLKKHRELEFEFEVGMLTFNKEGSRLFVIESVGWNIPKKWNVFSFPELESIARGNFPQDTQICQNSLNGKHIVYGRKDNTVGIIDVGLEKLVHTNDDHNGRLNGIQFSPDSTIFVTFCDDSLLRCYDTSTAKLQYQKPFGGLGGSNCKFSNDGKTLVAYTQIGMDSGTPIALDSATGNIKFRLKHENGVGEVFFSADDRYLFSGSRDFTAKMWDINDIENPKHTYNVGDWVRSVLVRPEHPDRLFLLSRSGDILIYDTETELYVDGPYRGAPGINFILNQLKTKPQADYFLALNAPNSLAVWPFATPEINPRNTAELVGFSGALSGVEMDESMALTVVSNRIENLKARADALQGDAQLTDWKAWHLSSDTAKNRVDGVNPEKYRQFLIEQNTLASLEEVLYSHPMDQEVLKLYAGKLKELSNKEEIEEYKRERYRISSAWYRSIAD